jgi:hypothetical protein
MPTDADLFRMLRAVMRIVDRHAETKTETGVLQVPVLPLEMKELRGSLEPFRPKYKALESLARKRLEEITEGAPPTGDEVAIRTALYAALTR